MQVQRQGDDHRFDVLAGQELPVVVVLLDVLGFAAVDAIEPLARRIGLADKNPLHVGRPNVGDGHKLEIILVVLADQDAALVAGADQAGLDRVALPLLVAVIGGCRDGHGGARGQQALHEIAAVDGMTADCGVKVGPSRFALLGGGEDGHQTAPTSRLLAVGRGSRRSGSLVADCSAPAPGRQGME